MNSLLIRMMKINVNGNESLSESEAEAASVNRCEQLVRSTI